MRHYEISFVFASRANKNLFSIKSTRPSQNLGVIELVLCQSLSYVLICKFLGDKSPTHGTFSLEL